MYAVTEIVINKSSDSMEVDLEDDHDDHKHFPYNINMANQGTQPVFDFIYRTKTPALQVLEQIICKYCHSCGSNQENPLVAICRCNGGIKYTHYYCLKTWIHNNVKIEKNQNETVTSYYIEAFNCELCKLAFPCKKYFLFSLNFFLLIFS